MMENKFDGDKVNFERIVFFSFRRQENASNPFSKQLQDPLIPQLGERSGKKRKEKHTKKEVCLSVSLKIESGLMRKPYWL